ncbi:hypothetical protein ACH5RR_021716 [Cinchona calisaya]|uniref:Transmembrane protein n=1 Tax=Cinchona calisaya TaxID=153742 RepID=A0ABD2ZL20_9GENT
MVDEEEVMVVVDWEWGWSLWSSILRAKPLDLPFSLNPFIQIPSKASSDLCGSDRYSFLIYHFTSTLSSYASPSMLMIFMEFIFQFWQLFRQLNVDDRKTLLESFVMMCNVLLIVVAVFWESSDYPTMAIVVVIWH